MATTLPRTRWKPWQPPSLDAPLSARTQAAGLQEAVEPESPPLPDPEEIRAEIEALREEARRVGQQQGYKAGHAEGLKAGQQEGQTQGEQQGYDAGFQAGYKAGMQRADTELADMHRMADAAVKAMENMQIELGQAIIRLAVQMAEQVLHGALRQHPDHLLDVVHDILQTDRHNDALLTLRVHPDDYALVRDYLQNDATAGHWRLLDDATLQRGDCLAETPLGAIDATLNTRWHRVTAAVGMARHTLAAPADTPDTDNRTGSTE